jgi:hypothetical protein
MGPLSQGEDIGVTVAIPAAGVADALASGSLTLLADAGHMLTDAAGIGLSLVAIWFGQRPYLAVSQPDLPGSSGTRRRNCRRQ